MTHPAQYPGFIEDMSSALNCILLLVYLVIYLVSATSQQTREHRRCCQILCTLTDVFLIALQEHLMTLLLFTVQFFVAHLKFESLGPNQSKLHKENNRNSTNHKVQLQTTVQSRRCFLIREKVAIYILSPRVYSRLRLPAVCLV